MGIAVATAATLPAVSLTEMRKHLKMRDRKEDLLIESYVAAATKWCETFTRRQFVTATFDYLIDNFPLQSHVRFPRVLRSEDDRIALPRSPLISITSVTYLDTAGVSTPFDALNYSADTASEPGYIFLKNGKTWPTVLDERNGVTIKFVAGYGNTTAVPATIKAAVRYLAAHYFANREAVNTESIPREVTLALKSLLWSERVPC